MGGRPVPTLKKTFGQKMRARNKIKGIQGFFGGGQGDLAALESIRGQVDIGLTMRPRWTPISGSGPVRVLVSS